jgi:hypothetical protein
VAAQAAPTPAGPAEPTRAEGWGWSSKGAPSLALPVWMPGDLPGRQAAGAAAPAAGEPAGAAPDEDGALPGRAS